MICVLQFDAASVAVLERLLAEGRLPALAELTARGRRLELETPAADFAAGAFYSLYSGVELGDHGIFYPFQWSAGEQRARYAAAFDAPPAVWERVGAAGGRTLAIDPYEGRPPERAEGVFVSRLGVRRSRRPRALVAARAGRARPRAPASGADPGRPRSSAARASRELLGLREKLVAAPGRVATLAEELLRRESFDLAWLTFARLAPRRPPVLGPLADRRGVARPRRPRGPVERRSTTSTSRSTGRSRACSPRSRWAPT